jgi:hypothetical protein
MKAWALALNNCSNAASISRAFLALSVIALQTQFLCSSLCVRLFDFDIGVGGIHQQRDSRNVRANFPEEFNSLCAKYILIKQNAGHVAAGAVYAFDQSEADGVAANREDHRHRVARKLRGARGRNIPGGGNGRNTCGHKLSRKRRQCRVVAPGPALFNADIFALDEAGLRQPLPKRVSIETIGIG